MHKEAIENQPSIPHLSVEILLDDYSIPSVQPRPLTDSEKNRLIRLVRLQDHRHHHSCIEKKDRRNDRTLSADELKNYPKCRYKFPFPVIEETCLFFDDSDPDRPELKMYVKRNEGPEQFINSYSPLLLYIWCANHDIKLIGNSLAAVAYITKYVVKLDAPDQVSLNSIVVDAIRDLHAVASIHSKLRTTVNADIGHQEIGKHQAIWILLGYPIVEKTYETLFVYVEHPSKHIPKKSESQKRKEADELREAGRNKDVATFKKFFTQPKVTNYFRPSDSMVLTDASKRALSQLIDNSSSSTVLHRLRNVSDDLVSEDRSAIHSLHTMYGRVDNYHSRYHYHSPDLKQRSKQMFENMCLFDFVRLYRVETVKEYESLNAKLKEKRFPLIKSDNVVRGYVVKRGKKKTVVVCPCPRLPFDEKNEDTCYALLLLYAPHAYSVDEYLSKYELDSDFADLRVNHRYQRLWKLVKRDGIVSEKFVRAISSRHQLERVLECVQLDNERVDDYDDHSIDTGRDRVDSHSDHLNYDELINENIIDFSDA